MKRISKPLLLAALLALCFAACKQDTKDFLPDDLIGKWVCGTEYWRYDSEYTAYPIETGSTVNVNGFTWDVGDDVQESEAQGFQWNVRGDQLTQIHILQNTGASLPKVYTLLSVTPDELQYRDNYGQTFTFTRVQ